MAGLPQQFLHSVRCPQAWNISRRCAWKAAVACFSRRWSTPPAFCEQLLRHPAIHLRTQAGSPAFWSAAPGNATRWDYLRANVCPGQVRHLQRRRRRQLCSTRAIFRSSPSRGQDTPRSPLTEQSGATCARVLRVQGLISRRAPREHIWRQLPLCRVDT